MTVSLNLTAIGREFGFDRSTGGRALEALVRAGLVRVEPRPGRRHLVTVILDANDVPKVTEDEPNGPTPMNAPTRTPARENLK